MFTYRIYLPTLEKYSYFKELKSIQYLTLCKLIQNADNTPVERFLTDVIKTSAQDKAIIPKLTRIDKLCILLNIRIMSISETLDLTVNPPQTDEKISIKCDLYDVLDKVTNFKFDYQKEIRISDECTIQTVIPTSLVSSDDVDIISASLKMIKIGGNKYNLEKYEKKHKTKILESLSSDIVHKLTESLKESNDNYNIDIISYRVPGEPEDNKYTLQLYNSSVFEFIKLIYNGNIEDQYYLRYILAKRLHFHTDYIDNRSPMDLTTYINFYKKELAEEKKQAEKQNQQPSMGLPPQNFGGGVA